MVRAELEQSATPVPTGGQWHRRPVLSRALRTVVFAGPAAASFAIGAGLAQVLPRATGFGSAALWIIVMGSVSLLSLIVFERAARRLLPLAALLNVSLLFPDKAPARFAVARKSGSPGELRARLDSARQGGHEDDARLIRRVVELVLALSVHDKQSRGHSERVRVFTDLLAEELKVPEDGRNRLRWAALLHDIGKLEVPVNLLKKPGKPTAAEWEILHRHPEDGARLIAPLLPWLGDWGAAVEQHHERFDGTGYPHRLKGAEISLAARIVAVADAYEVMTAPRPYKRAMTVSAARHELVSVAGSQLDPVIVRAFLNVSVGRLWRTIGFGAWVAQVPTLGRILSVGSWAGSGIATATTATVLAVGGIAGTGQGPVFAGPVALAPATAPARDHSRTRELADPATSATSPSSDPTAVPSPSDGSGASPSASPTDSPAPSRRPAPTPTPIISVGPSSPSTTPTPAPDPWSCSACTDTSPTCTSYCGAATNAVCVTYCSGTSNPVCTSHCTGTSNVQCLQYCSGPGNASCQANCTSAITAGYSIDTLRRGGSAMVLAALDVGSGARQDSGRGGVAGLA